MNIGDAKLIVNSKIKKYRLERSKNTLSVMYQLYLSEIVLGSSSLLCSLNNMNDKSLALGSTAIALSIPTVLLTTAEHKKHELTSEIKRLKKIRTYLNKGINILEDISVDEFSKEKTKSL